MKDNESVVPNFVMADRVFCLKRLRILSPFVKFHSSLNKAGKDVAVMQRRNEGRARGHNYPGAESLRSAE